MTLTVEQLQALADNPAVKRELDRAVKDAAAHEAAAPFLAALSDEWPAPARVTPHTAYADSLATFEVETVQAALDLLERFETCDGGALLAACNSERYKSSFVPADEFETRTRGKHGEPKESAPYWCKVDSWGCEVRAYAASGDSIVDICLKVRKPEIHATARRVDYRGGYRYESPQVIGAEMFFAHRIRMWAPADAINGWTLY